MVLGISKSYSYSFHPIWATVYEKIAYHGGIQAVTILSIFMRTADHRAPVVLRTAFRMADSLSSFLSSEYFLRTTEWHKNSGEVCEHFQVRSVGVAFWIFCSHRVPCCRKWKRNVKIRKCINCFLQKFKSAYAGWPGTTESWQKAAQICVYVNVYCNADDGRTTANCRFHELGWPWQSSRGKKIQRSRPNTLKICTSMCVILFPDYFGPWPSKQF